jgi:hypothetical protein
MFAHSIAMSNGKKQLLNARKQLRSNIYITIAHYSCRTATNSAFAQAGLDV